MLTEIVIKDVESARKRACFHVSLFTFLNRGVVPPAFAKHAHAAKQLVVFSDFSLEQDSEVMLYHSGTEYLFRGYCIGSRKTRLLICNKKKSFSKV